MLDTKQMLPRVVGGSLVMFLTIAIVALFAYHVLESGGNPEAPLPKHTAKPPEEALKSPKYTHHAKALHRIHTRGRTAVRKRHESPSSWMESIVDGRPHENSVNQRRLLSIFDDANLA
jgi:hypothetical protein